MDSKYSYLPLFLLSVCSAFISKDFFNFVGIFSLLSFVVGLLKPSFILPFFPNPNIKKVFVVFVPLMLASVILSSQKQSAIEGQIIKKNVSTSPAATSWLKEVKQAEIKVLDAEEPMVTDLATPTSTITLLPSFTSTPSLPRLTYTPYRFPTSTPVPQIYESTSQETTSAYSCNCAKTCPNLSCDEAYFQLLQCGCSQRDGDNDGMPCEAQCR